MSGFIKISICRQRILNLIVSAHETQTQSGIHNMRSVAAAVTTNNPTCWHRPDLVLVYLLINLSKHLIIQLRITSRVVSSMFHRKFGSSWYLFLGATAAAAVTAISNLTTTPSTTTISVQQFVFVMFRFQYVFGLKHADTSFFLVIDLN